MDDFDKIFDYLEKMLRESLDDDFVTDYGIPVDINNVKDKIYLTFQCDDKPNVFIDEEEKYLVIKLPYRTKKIKLPCKVDPEIKLTYKENTGVADVQLKKARC